MGTDQLTVRGSSGYLGASNGTTWITNGSVGATSSNLINGVGTYSMDSITLATNENTFTNIAPATYTSAAAIMGVTV